MFPHFVALWPWTKLVFAPTEGRLIDAAKRRGTRYVGEPRWSKWIKHPPRTEVFIIIIMIFLFDFFTIFFQFQPLERTDGKLPRKHLHSESGLRWIRLGNWQGSLPRHEKIEKIVFFFKIFHIYNDTIHELASLENLEFFLSCFLQKKILEFESFSFC